jgi:hypothetical protein
MIDLALLLADRFAIADNEPLILAIESAVAARAWIKHEGSVTKRLTETLGSSRFLAGLLGYQVIPPADDAHAPNQTRMRRSRTKMRNPTRRSMQKH